ncbi:MAG: DUF177 domain-containing protein [Ignavibacteriales bacterium]|nr:DUF177 domain-containing protein [Ignavibacteriales bacterium]
MKHVKNRDNELLIRISGLSNGIHNYNLVANPNLLELNEQFQETVNVQTELDKSTHQIYLKAKIETAGIFQCDRCLENFRKSISLVHRICYVYSENEGKSFPPEELQIISPDTVSIDLSEDIRQALTVSVPLKLLCSEECKGLCRQCGTNLNNLICRCEPETTDPRWQGLRDLLKK